MECKENIKHVSPDLKAKKQTPLTDAWRDDPLIVVWVDTNVVGF